MGSSIDGAFSTPTPHSPMQEDAGKGDADTAGPSCIKLFGVCAVFLCCIGFGLVVPIFLIVSGAHFSNTPCKSNISLYLILQGVYSLFAVCAASCVIAMSQSGGSDIASVWSSCVSLAGLVLNVFGYIWVFGTNEADCSPDDRFLGWNLREWGFNYIIGSFIAAGAICFCVCFMGCAAAIAARRQNQIAQDA